MPNRYVPIKAIHSFLSDRDGEQCSGLPAIEGHPKFECTITAKLVVNHINHKKNDWRPENLNLLCHRCNLLWESPLYNGELSKQGSVNKSVSVCTQNELEEEIEVKSPELKIEQEKEPIYYRWLFDNIEREQGVTMAQALNEGAYYCEISPVTAKRYFSKLYYANILSLGLGTKGNRRVVFPESKEEAEKRMQEEIKTIYKRFKDAST